ncbi:MAG: TFIIB-type zinc ribbon-containing protein, partial [Nitrososphaeraceae archaeon]
MQTRPSAICPVCKSDLLIITDPESGEIICNGCGMIVLDKIQNINQPEWHAFSNEERNDRSRTGIPTSLAIHDMGLATVIGRSDRDASGRKIDAAMHATMQRLRTWDSRAHIRTSSDISLIQAFNELDIVKDKLALP